MSLHFIKYLVSVFLTGHCRQLGSRDFELRSVRTLNGEKRFSFKGAADVVVGDIQQLVVRDVVRHVTYALLHPLEQNKTVSGNKMIAIRISVTKRLIMVISTTVIYKTQSLSFGPNILGKSKV